MTIVAFDKLAGRYDDLFSRSRIGAQRGAVWEVLADTFCPGDAILALNCRTREDALFLSLLDVSVVACDSQEGMTHAGQNPPIQFDVLPTEYLSKRCPGALFDGALSNFSGLNSVADLNRTARDLASMVTLGAPVIVCSLHPILPFRNALVSLPWQSSKGIPPILCDRDGESRRMRRENTLPGLEESEEVVFAIFFHALLHGDRRSDSAVVSRAGLPQISPSPWPTTPN